MTPSFHKWARPLRPRFCGAGFSLVELLVVMVIVVILLSLGMVGFNSIVGGQKLTNAESLMIGQMALARQTAISRNTRVRWQILKVPDRRNGDGEEWRLMRLQVFDPAAREWTPLGRLHMLPISIVAHSNTSYSTLLGAGNVTNVNDLTLDGKSGVTAPAVTVVFRSDGGTSLNPNAIHTLLLNDPKNPANFSSVQVDPISGAARTFRP